MQNLTFFGSPVIEIPIISFFLNHHHHRQCPPLFSPHHHCLLATITLLSPSLMAASSPHLSPTTRTARMMSQCQITNWMGTRHIDNNTGDSRCHVTGYNVASTQWTMTSLLIIVVVSVSFFSQMELIFQTFHLKLYQMTSFPWLQFINNLPMEVLFSHVSSVCNSSSVWFFAPKMGNHEPQLV